jgi:hypothetical protein
MFRKEIVIDSKSYLELVSRKSGDQEMLALTMRGPKENGQVALASVSLTIAEVQTLAEQLQAWLANPKV